MRRLNYQISKMITKKRKLVFLLLLIAFNKFAFADSTFQLQWSGASFGNAASATGTLTLNSTGLSYLTSPNSGPGASSPPTAVGFTAFSMTISGAGSGNGTISLANNGGTFYLWTPATLNTNTQLIGQSLGGGRTFGQTTGLAGDFNYFPGSGYSGRGVSYFTFETSNGLDMLLTSFTLGGSGPSSTDTQQSLVNTASALQSSLTLQNTVMINGFTYDCQVFDKNGICVSVGGRNTQVSAGSINNTSGLLIGSYRLDANSSRVGLSLDQNFSTSMPGGTIKQSNNTPMVGVFGVYQENLDNTGWEGKVSVAMGQKDTTIQRSVVGTSEPGVGSATMLSQGAQATAKYGFGVMKDVLVLPYAGLRYTRNNMGGYTEATSSAVTAPLVMAPVKTNSSAALIGIEGRYRVMPDLMTYASAGLERNMSTNYENYVATNSSIGALTPVSMNPNMVRTRPTATLGAYYDIEKNQRLGVTGIYRQEMYQAVGTTTVMATYTVGL